MGYFTTTLPQIQNSITIYFKVIKRDDIMIDFMMIQMVLHPTIYPCSQDWIFRFFCFLHKTVTL